MWYSALLAMILHHIIILLPKDANNVGLQIHREGSFALYLHTAVL